MPAVRRAAKSFLMARPFGDGISAATPRILQGALKFNF
jgi:hypothetical protein